MFAAGDHFGTEVLADAFFTSVIDAHSNFDHLDPTAEFPSQRRSSWWHARRTFSPVEFFLPNTMVYTAFIQIFLITAAADFFKYYKGSECLWLFWQL